MYMYPIMIINITTIAVKIGGATLHNVNTKGVIT